MARVKTSRKSTTGSVRYGRGELSPFCNKISPVVYISRPVASEGQVEKSYEQEQKFQSGKRWKEFA